MNRLNPITSDVLGSVSNILSQSMEKVQEWGGHVVRYLKQIPEFLSQHPAASIALIASANILFFFIMNSAVKRVDKHLADENKERSYKQIFICETLFAVSVFSFNSLLSKVTKAQLSYTVLTAITATALSLRILLNHFLFKQETEAPEQEVEQPSPLPEKQGTSEIDQVLEEDSSDKPPVSSPKHRVEIAGLNLKIAKEKARADELLSKQSNTEVKIKELEAEIAKLAAAKETLEEEKEMALGEGSEVKKEAERLKEVINELVEKGKSLESEKDSLLEQVQNLKNELTQAKEAKGEAEEALEGLQEEIKQEREQKDKAVASLKSFKAKGEEKINGKKLSIEEKQKLEKRIAALIEEKDEVEAEKDQALEDLKEASEKIAELESENREIAEGKLENAQLFKETQDKLTDAAAETSREKKRVDREIEMLGDAFDAERGELENRISELEEKVELQETLIKGFRIKKEGKAADTQNPATPAVVNLEDVGTPKDRGPVRASRATERFANSPRSKSMVPLPTSSYKEPSSVRHPKQSGRGRVAGLGEGRTLLAAFDATESEDK